MGFRVETVKGHRIAVFSGDAVVLSDVQSALDLVADVHALCESDRILLPKSAVAEDFFALRTGIAGEALQKLVNYGAKLAVIGDFSAVTSRALRDFIYECNRGRDIFFVASEAEGLERLSR